VYLVTHYHLHRLRNARVPLWILHWQGLLTTIILQLTLALVPLQPPLAAALLDIIRFSCLVIPIARTVDRRRNSYPLVDATSQPQLLHAVFRGTSTSQIS